MTSEGYLAELRRETAYHEAGHAAVYLFFGCGGDLISISMMPNDQSSARVCGNGVMWGHDLQVAAYMNSDNPSTLTRALAKTNAYRIMMLRLAGPFAEVKARNESADYDNWLNDLLESHHDDDTGTDAANAIQTAYAAVGTRGTRPWTMLRRCAKWVEEAISEPAMWRAVESLATRLISVDYLDGEEAWNIMEEAYGPMGPTPAYTPKWRRRLNAKTNTPAIYAKRKT